MRAQILVAVVMLALSGCHCGNPIPGPATGGGSGGDTGAGGGSTGGGFSDGGGSGSTGGGGGSTGTGGGASGLPGAPLACNSAIASPLKPSSFGSMLSLIHFASHHSTGSTATPCR